MILIYIFFIFILSFILLALNYVISSKPKLGREKSSTFECGFDPKTYSRLPFSMHFFLIALIFLIFDVEISLMIPLPYTWNFINSSAIMWATMSVLSILLLGALVEWMEGSLEWHA